jgi:hypothetical protein
MCMLNFQRCGHLATLRICTTVACNTELFVKMRLYGCLKADMIEALNKYFEGKIKKSFLRCFVFIYIGLSRSLVLSTF